MLLFFKTSRKNMPPDTEIQREMWSATVPVQFTLSASEVRSIDKPASVYLLVPRVTYFPFLYEHLVKYFEKFLDASAAPSTSNDISHIWLECGTVPLRWHYPVGVLYDTLVSSESLPWQLTVHFQDFPLGELLPLESLDALRSHFMQSVKEADQLKHKADVINEMQEREHRLLWNGLLNNDFERFWSVNRLLMSNDGDKQMKYVPVRLYLSWGINGAYRQRLIKPFNADNQRTTVAEACALLTENIPNFTYSPKVEQVRTHSVTIPPETPVVWMAENMAYPDNFVHLTLLMGEKCAPADS